MRFTKKAIYAIILLLICSKVFADSSNSSMQSFLDNWRMQNKVPGVILLMNTPAQHRTFTSGTTLLNGNDHVTSKTLFAIGSITKTFTSAMILRLEAKHKLNINDKIGKYFPKYPRWNNVTIKQLLNMTSGISNFTEDPNWVENLKNGFKTTWSQDQIINSSYQQHDYFKPGKGWHYSNTNYILLGKIIENITQQKLEKLFKEQFFQPLELKNTYYSDHKYSPEILKQMAHGYYDAHDMTTTIMIKNLSDMGPPGAGMLMDTIDLESWIDHLLIKKDVLPKKQLNEMLDGVATPYNKINDPNSKYGLGIGISSSKKTGKMLSYAGTFPGYGSTFLWLPKYKILIIIQMNVNRHGDDESSYLHFPSQSLIQGVLNKLM